MSNQRQGKIARLPARIREELNLRILDGENGRKILAWLNALPEAKGVEEDAEGLKFSDSNLSIWRHGGYADWLKRRERIERTKELADYSLRVAQAGGGQLTEGAAAIASGKFLEHLELLDDLLADAQQRPADKPVTAEEMTAITASVTAVTEALSALRVGDQNNRRLEQNDIRLKQNQARVEQNAQILKLDRDKFEFSAVKACLKTLPQLKAIAGDNSLDEAGKIDAARQLLFGAVAE